MSIENSNLIYYPIGWLYIWIRYRKKSLVKNALIEKYENSYSVAGTLVIFKTFGIIFLILIALLLFSVIYSLIRWR